jgi:hypothetical protein
MVNYQNPATIESDFSTYAFLSGFSGLQIYWSVSSIAALVKLWHLVDGMFM